MIPRPRDWDWFPHLALIYGAVAVAWFALGALFYLLFANDVPPFLDAAPPEGGWHRLAGQVYGAFLLLGFPAMAAWATVRVSLNERRWRREGDPRAR